MVTFSNILFAFHFTLLRRTNFCSIHTSSSGFTFFSVLMLHLLRFLTRLNVSETPPLMKQRKKNIILYSNCSSRDDAKVFLLSKIIPDLTFTVQNQSCVDTVPGGCHHGKYFSKELETAGAQQVNLQNEHDFAHS